MPKRKFDVKLRKVGNSYVVTIPKETIDRFELKEGDYLAIDFDSDEIKKIPRFKTNHIKTSQIKRPKRRKWQN